MSKANGKGRLIPAVGYARRSTDKQEASIPDQRKAVDRYAGDNGYRILRWYTDDAISGDDTEKRLGFQQMLADAKDRKDFEAILVWDQDRFGRFSPHEASYWTFPLAKANIRLVTTAKGPIDWSDFTEWLTYSVNQHGKHQFLRDLSRNVARGQLEAAKNGSWASGQPPYAYRIEGPKKDKHLVLDDPAKARIVKRIFREYVEDVRPMKNIADRLNAEGVLSPGGRMNGWRFDTVRVILENPAYTGDYAGCRYSFGKYNTIHKGNVVESDGRCERPESEWIVHRDRHEAIIDRATFGKAAARLDKGKNGRTPYTRETSPYILSGLLRCGLCGATLHGTGNGKNRYYECGNKAYNGRGACKGTTVKEETILIAVADHLDDEFLSLDRKGWEWKASRKELKPGDLPKGFAKLKRLVAPPQQPRVDRRRLEKQAKTLAEQIDKARRNLVHLDSENIPSAQAEIRRLQTEEEQLAVELRKQPPTEQDINAETYEILGRLNWLSLFFRLATGPQPGDGVDLLIARLAFSPSVVLPDVKKALRRIEGITVHTRIRGEGLRTRHHFERGEIAFSPVGADTGKVNSHRTD